MAPEGDAFCFAQIASHTGVSPDEEDFSSADADDVLASLCAATSEMDEKQVTAGTRILFITPTLKGVLDDFSYANPMLPQQRGPFPLQPHRERAAEPLLHGNHPEPGHGRQLRLCQGGLWQGHQLHDRGMGAGPRVACEARDGWGRPPWHAGIPDEVLEQRKATRYGRARGRE